MNTPLRLVPGNPEPTDPNLITADELPLGPVAGATITAWVTPATVHLDQSCAPKSAKPEELMQPNTGSFADRNLPDRTHCQPTGEIGDYMTAANGILMGSRRFIDTRHRWETGDAGYSLARELRWTIPGDVPESLAPAAQRLTEQAAELRRQILGDASYGFNDRLELAMAAKWVSAGRTRGKYQRQYETALNVTQSALDHVRAAARAVSDEGRVSLPRDKAGWEALIADAVDHRDRERWHARVTARDLDVTQRWFDLVADGVQTEQATDALVRTMVDEVMFRARHGIADQDEQGRAVEALAVWVQAGLAIGEALDGYLAGIVAPVCRQHVIVVWDPGEVLVGNLGDVVEATMPLVRAFDGDRELFVAKLPATVRLYLEDERPRRYLILDEPFMLSEDGLVAFTDTLVGANGRLIDVPERYRRGAGQALRAKSLDGVDWRNRLYAATVLEAAANRGRYTSEPSSSPAVLRPTDVSAPS